MSRGEGMPVLALIRTYLYALCCVLPLWAHASPAPHPPVQVFAAASLQGALDDVVEAFHTQSSGRITVSYAGSSVLARQIALGAPADIFLSANTRWADWLSEEGVDSLARTQTFSNQMVLVGGAAVRATALSDIDQNARIAIALSDSVPAGIYAREALTTLGLWDQLKGQIVETDNVRAAASLVRLGAVPYGIVYASDAHGELALQQIAFLPNTSHTPSVWR